MNAKRGESTNYIEHDGKRYYRCKSGYYKCADGKWLHRVIWEEVNGPIPKGFHIHHIDEDKSNNDPLNLEMVNPKTHSALHLDAEHRDAFARNMIENALPAAVEWHKSPEGHKWHKKQYDNYMAKLWEKEITLNCAYCGKPFTTKYITRSRAKYCSGKCKASARRHDLSKQSEHICVYCGKVFLAYDNSRVKTCSPECAKKHSKQIRLLKSRHQE